MTRYLSLFFIVLLGGCDKPKQALSILTFTDYIDRTVVSDFEKQFDCKVVLDFVDTGDAIMAKIEVGGNAVYDIVCIGDGETPVFAGLGLLNPLRTGDLQNLKNVDPEFIRRSSDPDHRYSIPYAWFAVGLYVQRPKDRPLNETWGLLFDPKRQRGSFLLLDESRTCIAAALCYLG